MFGLGSLIAKLFKSQKSEEPKEDKELLLSRNLMDRLSSIDTLLNMELLNAVNAADARLGYVAGESPEFRARLKCEGLNYLMSEQGSGKYLVFAVTVRDSNHSSTLFSRLYLRGFEKKYEHHPQIAADFLREIRMALKIGEGHVEWPMDDKKRYLALMHVKYPDAILIIESGGGGLYSLKQGGLKVEKTSDEFRGVAFELKEFKLPKNNKFRDMVRSMIQSLPGTESPYAGIKINYVEFF